MSNINTLIGRGLASAKPGTPFEGWIYYSTDTGALERYSGSAWEPVAGTPIVYKFDSGTTDVDPGSGEVAFNNATPANVTEIYIDDNPANHSGIDFSGMWQDIVGGHVLIHGETDDGDFLFFTVDSATDETPSYTKLVVTILDSGSLPTAADGLEVHIFGGGGGGGGGGTVTTKGDLEGYDTSAARVPVGSLGQVLVADTAQTLGLGWKDAKDVGNWWDSPMATTVCEQHFASGSIVGFFGLDGVTIGTGVTDADGMDGSDGHTELDVMCSCFYDISPANASFRIISVPQPDVARADVGHYYQTYARWANSGDQAIFFGGIRNGTYSNTTSVFDRAHFDKISTDTNWQCISADGTTRETTDSGVAWSATAWINMEIYVYDDGGTMTTKFWIDGVLVATHVTNCPTATQENLNLIAGSYWTDADITTNSVVWFMNRVVWRVNSTDVLTALGRAAFSA